MNQTTSLARYTRMIQGFLDGRVAAGAFADAFFRAFQDDPGGWMGQGVYQVLNSIATACECYSPDDPDSEFDLSEEELRQECDQGLGQLRRLARDI